MKSEVISNFMKKTVITKKKILPTNLRSISLTTKFKHSKIRMNSLVSKVIFVIFLIWKYNHSFDVKTSPNRPLCMQNESQVLTNQRLKRIMAENGNNTNERNFKSGNNSVKKRSSNNKSRKSDVEHINMLKNMCSNISETLRSVVDDMERTYNMKKGHMEQLGKKDEFTDQWIDFISHMYNTIEYKLDLEGMRACRSERNVNILTSMLKTDFEFFQDAFRDEPLLTGIIMMPNDSHKTKKYIRSTEFENKKIDDISNEED